MAMELIGSSSPYLYPITIAATIVVLALSLLYTARNILRIWNRGNPRQAEAAPNKKQEAEIKEEEEEVDRGAGGEGGNLSAPVEETRDPLEYCEHIQSEVKKAQQKAATKKVYPKLTPEQMAEERRIQNEQLQAIFRLMENQGEKFGIESMDDMKQQMKLYA